MDDSDHFMADDVERLIHGYTLRQASASSASAFVDGAVSLMAAGEGQRWWPLVLGGIVGIATGVLTFMYPGSVALALVFVVGAWAIVTGILEIFAAIRLRTMISDEWLLGLSGVLSIVFGALVKAQPGAGALTLVYLFGFYAILAGITQISLGIRPRCMGEDVKGVSQTASSTSRRAGALYAPELPTPGAYAQFAQVTQ